MSMSHVTTVPSWLLSDGHRAEGPGDDQPD